MDSEIILKAEHISITFPGVKALDDVHVAIKRGKVHALCGENGAGKSTLLKILTGIYPKDEGDIYLDGNKVSISSIKDARNLGIYVVPQEMQMNLDLSVAENIFIGRYPTNRFGIIDWKRMYEWADELQKKLSEGTISLDLHAKVRTLRMGQWQLIEILRSMVDDNIRVIAFDEPTAALSGEETRLLFKLIKELKEKGIAIIYVSHRLNEVFEICDEITVLKDGKYVDTRAVEGLQTTDIIKMMTGRNLDLYGEPKDTSTITDKVMLRIENFSKGDKYSNVSFEARKGEIVGLYGLVGSGRTEVMRSLFGLDERDSGEVYIDGEKVNIASPIFAKKYGLGFVTEDRRREGLILISSLKHNISLPNLSAICNAFHLLNNKKETAYAKEAMSRFTIKAPNENALSIELSGGNQQKVIIAKWIQANCDILIVDEPTRGIDVGAKTEVYSALKQLASSGKTIIMVSSELPEILGISDRILVMNEGHLTANMENKNLTEEAVIAYAVQ